MKVLNIIRKVQFDRFKLGNRTSLKFRNVTRKTTILSSKKDRGNLHLCTNLQPRVSLFTINADFPPKSIPYDETFTRDAIFKRWARQAYLCLTVIKLDFPELNSVSRYVQQRPNYNLFRIIVKSPTRDGASMKQTEGFASVVFFFPVQLSLSLLLFF